MFLELFAGVALLAGLCRLGTRSTETRPRAINHETIAVEESKLDKPKPKLFSIDVEQISYAENSFMVNDKNKFFYTEICSIPEVPVDSDIVTFNILYGNDSYIIRFINTENQLNHIVEISRQVIISISSTISEVYELSINQYLRDSTIISFGAKLESFTESFRKAEENWLTKFDEKTIEKLIFLEKYLPLSEGKTNLRERYEFKKLEEREKFYDEIESNPLTKQQRLAVIRENDLNLILAAAGTGKTSVIVTKALDLISSAQVESDEILILAYNNFAAKELKERILTRAKLSNIDSSKLPHVSTFHSLGMRILKESKIPSFLSEFSNDEIKLRMWVTQWLVDYIKSSPSSLKNFIELSHQPINPFDFNSKEEYDAYIRDNEYRTLQGERVKGYQELLIANWLFINGVDYEYEAPYISKRRIEIGFNYRPDFHFKDTAIYLEHFGIDRKGNTREGIDKKGYNKFIQDKRMLHQECDTTLVETFHYDWVEGNLEKRLAELVVEVGVRVNPRPFEEIFNTLNNMGFIDECAKRYMACVQAIRFEKLDYESTLQRLTQSNIFHAQKYSALLNDLHESYKKELDRQNKIDFDDMILKSTELVISGRFIPKWNYILVDEFQDISTARMDLLKSLVRFGPSVPVLSVVGDDWQSIYRFNGGKLELTTRIGEYLGSHSLTRLEETFRYSSSIAEVAGTFIMKNPEQYRKEVRTQVQDNQSNVHLLDTCAGSRYDLNERIVQTVNRIRQNDSVGSIVILARYNYLLTEAKARIRMEKKLSDIKYWTFHKAKGLEADYCILVGFIQGKMGFPNMNKENAVIEALLPSLDKYPHSEERRLFYVAITRARKKCYIIADPMAPSSFINEILTTEYNLHIASSSFEERFRKTFKCPVCTDGYFKITLGKYGDYYSCTTGPVCNSHPRKCEKCGAPSIDDRGKSVCNNESCRNEKVICDRCGRPMKIRESRFGKFLGCTGYAMKDDQCKNTRQLY